MVHCIVSRLAIFLGPLIESLKADIDQSEFKINCLSKTIHFISYSLHLRLFPKVHGCATV